MTTPRFLLLPLALIALATPSIAQTIGNAEDVVEANQLTLNMESKPSLYAGAYHFGFSEGESELKLTVKGSNVTGTLIYGLWDDRSMQFKPKTHRFQGKIVGAMLLAPGWNGVFVNHGNQKGLVFFQAPTDYASMQFGYLLSR